MAEWKEGDLQALGQRHGVPLGAPILRTIDRNIAALQAKVEEYIDEARRWRNRALALERELLGRLGPCSLRRDCRLHAGHWSPCEAKGE